MQHRVTLKNEDSNVLGIKDCKKVLYHASGYLAFVNENKAQRFYLKCGFNTNYGSVIHHIE